MVIEDRLYEIAWGTTRFEKRLSAFNPGTGVASGDLKSIMLKILLAYETELSMDLG